MISGVSVYSAFAIQATELVAPLRGAAALSPVQRPPIQPIGAESGPAVRLNLSQRARELGLRAYEQATRSEAPIDGQEVTDEQTILSGSAIEAEEPVAPLAGGATVTSGVAAVAEDAAAPGAGPGVQSESSKLPAPGEHTPEEQAEIDELVRRDREVRSHEQAHKAAGGAYAGAVHLAYATGPDGRRYATSGEVPIDLSPIEGDPEATLRKLAVVKRAANAPASPSSADRQVAAHADALAAKARAELQSARRDGGNEVVHEQRDGQGERGGVGAEEPLTQPAEGGNPRARRPLSLFA